eukprot:757124-Hanusia_phi.AAC.2
MQQHPWSARANESEERAGAGERRSIEGKNSEEGAGDVQWWWQHKARRGWMSNTEDWEQDQDKGGEDEVEKSGNLRVLDQD